MAMENHDGAGYMTFGPIAFRVIYKLQNHYFPFPKKYLHVTKALFCTTTFPVSPSPSPSRLKKICMLSLQTAASGDRMHVLVTGTTIYSEISFTGSFLVDSSNIDIFWTHGHF